MPKTILVPLSGQSEDTVALSTALVLARGTAAHVVALAVRRDPRDSIPLTGEGVPGPLLEEILRAAELDAEARAKDARKAFEQIAATFDVPLVAGPPGPGGVSAGFLDPGGRMDEVVVRHARLADLTVFSRKAAHDDGFYGAALESALMTSGRPILLAPDVTPATVGTCVAVAWNGGRESSRAVAAALPLLQAARQVVVLTAETSATNASAVEGLTEYFSWHGIAATTQIVRSAGAVGASVMAAAQSAGADLLVMGGYGHSRVREMILGGVTQWMLDHGGLPVFMEH